MTYNSIKSDSLVFLDIIILLMAQKPQKFDYLSKVVIIGDSAVGKTNILLREVNQEYKINHTSTIGVDFKVKTIPVNDKKIKMQIWDTAGQQRYRTITATYYKGASGIILVYAINDRKTFNNVQVWLRQITEVQKEQVPKIIVGNKSDCSQMDRQVTYAQGKIFAERYGLQFVQCSAKENRNICKIFQQIGKQIITKKGEQIHVNVVNNNLIGQKPLCKKRCGC